MQAKNQESVTKYVYIALAVIIAAAMTVSVITAINKKRNAPTPKEPEITQQTAPPINVYPEETEKPEEQKKPLETVAPPETEKETDEVVILPDEPDEPIEPDEPVIADTEEIPVIEKTEFAPPVLGSIMKGYSPDMPVFSLTMNDYRVHSGVDIAAEIGDPVSAVAKGTIAKIYQDPMMGKTVVIYHGEGIYSVYQNLQSTLPEGIESGREVRLGDVIGAVGETGIIECADRTHLHFAMMENDSFIDPGEYIAELKVSEEE